MFRAVGFVFRREGYIPFSVWLSSWGKHFSFFRSWYSTLVVRSCCLCDRLSGRARGGRCWISRWKEWVSRKAYIPFPVCNGLWYSVFLWTKRALWLPNRRRTERWAAGVPLLREWCMKRFYLVTEYKASNRRFRLFCRSCFGRYIYTDNSAAGRDRWISLILCLGVRRV